MSFAGLLLIAIGVSADAFAVALTMGVKMRQFAWKYILTIALVFGGFQVLMPLLGWFLGENFLQYISAVDHWVAFGLLLLVGGKMLKEAFSSEDEESEAHDGEQGFGSDAVGTRGVATECADSRMGNQAVTATVDTLPQVKQLAVNPKLAAGSLLLLGVAESIDALAVGITFPVTGVNVWSAIALIGIIATALSAAAVWIGHKLGSRFSKPAEIIGGLILIGLGVQVLFEHLG